MTSPDFKSLLREASRAPAPETLNALMEMVGQRRVAEDQVFGEFAAAVERRDWTTVAILLECIIAIRGSPKFAPLLAQVLDEGHENINNEDIVDLLSLMHDERAIPALRRAAAREFPGDAMSRWINRKALQALAGFADQGAWETIRSAADASNEQLREEARKLLAEKR